MSGTFESETSMTITLNIQRADGLKDRKTLHDGETVVIGRAPGSDLELPGEDVSDTHCMIGYENGSVWVRDCYSRTGTLIRGAPVSETTITDSADINVGGHVISVVVAGAAMAQPSVDQSAPLSQPPVAPPTTSPQATPEVVVAQPLASESEAAPVADPPIADLLDSLRNATVTPDATPSTSNASVEPPAPPSEQPPEAVNSDALAAAIANLTGEAANPGGSPAPIVETDVPNSIELVGEPVAAPTQTEPDVPSLDLPPLDLPPIPGIEGFDTEASAIPDLSALEALTAEPKLKSETALPPAESDAVVGASAEHAADAPNQSLPSVDTPATPSAFASLTGDARTDALQVALDEARSEIMTLRDRLRTASLAQDGPVDADASFQQEMVELLRSEVEQLQAEVAARDERIAELGDASENDSVAAVPADAEEINRLTARIEQLMFELSDKDEQLIVLQEMLQAAEEQNTAELEERQQLESWVANIESRIKEREDVWATRVSQLEQRLAESLEEGKRAQVALSDSQYGNQSEALETMVQQLREEKLEIANKLDESQRQTAELTKQLETVRENVAREESIRISEERAALARERYELNELRMQFQEDEEEAPRGKDDDKIRAFREHLREIHKQEKKGKEGKGLGARISRLWNSVDE